MPTTDDFRIELQAQIARAAKQGRPHIEVNAGELHRVLGGYPPKAGGPNHAMPTCCNVMWEEMNRGRSEVIFKTDSGQAAAFTVRYYLPR